MTASKQKVEPLAVPLVIAAAMVGISVDKLKQHIDRSELVASYIDYKPVIKLKELERWLDARPSERPESGA